MRTGRGELSLMRPDALIESKRVHKKGNTVESVS